VETILFVGLWLFAVTHLDTLVVISAFCADNDYRLWEVLVGHYIGFCVGLVAAVIGTFLAAELLEEWTFLLGVVPLGMGLWGIFRGPPETSLEGSAVVPDAFGRVGVVSAAGIGLSGENIAVFIPFFAELTSPELTIILAIYLLGAGVVFLAAFLIVSRVVVNGIPDWLDRWLVPTVLVLVGGYVIVTGWTVT